MRVNIENAARGSCTTTRWALEELVRNLKELRERTRAGDMASLDEFFNIFVFDGDEQTPS
jgi:hypothetical protein